MGVTAAVQGGLFLADRSDRASGTWAVGLLTVITGALLLIGLLTPIASILVGLTGVGVALSRFPTTPPGLFDSSLTTILVVIMAVAIGFLGRGRFHSTHTSSDGARSSFLRGLRPNPDCSLRSLLHSAHLLSLVYCNG